MVIELLVSLLLAAVTYVLYTFFYLPLDSYFFYKRQGVPAAKFRFFVGNVPDIRKDIAEDKVFRWPLECLRTLGRVYLGFFMTQPRLYVTDPALIQELFVTRANVLRKPKPPGGMLARVVGDGVLLSEGEKWKKHRKMLTPAFHFTSLKQMIPLMVKCTDRGLDALEKKIEGQTSQTEMSRMFSALTLDIIGSSAFGTDFSESQAESDAVYESMTFLFEKVIQDFTRIWRRLPFYRKMPFPSNIRFKVDKARLDSIVKKFIEKRLADPCEPGQERDLLDLMLTASNGSPLTPEEIRDECMTFILAGHETTSLLLSWCILWLGKNPEVLQKLVQEIDSVFADSDDEWTWEKIQQLTYTTQVLKETLRICPPAFLIVRNATCDIEVDSYKIRQGTDILCHIYTLHHDPELWPNPEQFDPNRFDESTESKKRHPCAFMPFAVGPRNCIGNNFALLEAKIILSKLLKRFQFTMDPNHPVLFSPLVTLRPKTGVLVDLKVRS